MMLDVARRARVVTSRSGKRDWLAVSASNDVVEASRVKVSTKDAPLRRLICPSSLI